MHLSFQTEKGKKLHIVTIPLLTHGWLKETLVFGVAETRSCFSLYLYTFWAGVVFKELLRRRRNNTIINL